MEAGRLNEVKGEVTELLHRWREGDPEVMEELMPLVFGQLHSVASGYMRRERENHTLQPTALVNEVYLRLLQQRKVRWDDRVHFFVFSAKVMRNILKDHARARLADRRGGNWAIRLPISQEVAWIGTSAEEILDLDRAIGGLEALDRRKARLIEMHFFLGLTIVETASLLDISLATAERDLKFARSWLHSELTDRRQEKSTP